MWLCAAALAAIALAGCGSISASSTGAATAASPKASSSPSPSPSVSPSAAATQAALCQHTATVTGLEITRNHVHAGTATAGRASLAEVIVATPARARAAARALCGLPSLPRGVFHCPALTVGTTYLLRFTADGRQLPAVSIEATGCEVVTGVGPGPLGGEVTGVLAGARHGGEREPAGADGVHGRRHVELPADLEPPDQANDCPEQNAPASGAVS